MSKNYMNNSQASEIVKYISDTMKFPIMGAGGGFAPIGIYGWSPDYVTGAPQGWLRCEGQIINIADYPELATFYASQHGASNYWGGDGITTFAVPDLRGEFIRGAGTNSHVNQGNGGAVGEHQDGTEIPQIVGGSGKIYISDTNSQNGIKKPDSMISNTDYVGGVSGTSGSASYAFNTTRPTNTSGVFFVKATLSDAEINAFNVYTPREHQVAWWEEKIDGVWKRKPVYERTVESNNGISLSANSWADTSISASTMDQMIDIIGYNTSDKWVHKALMCSPNGSGGVLEIYNCRGTCILHKITIRYTKTTDQWQTS